MIVIDWNIIESKENNCQAIVLPGISIFVFSTSNIQVVARKWELSNMCNKVWIMHSHMNSELYKMVPLSGN